MMVEGEAADLWGQLVSFLRDEVGRDGTTCARTASAACHVSLAGHSCEIAAETE